METTFDYLRTHATELGSRILETYPPLQSTKDPVAPSLTTLLRYQEDGAIWHGCQSHQGRQPFSYLALIPAPWDGWS
jgi:hypothetical protein